LLKNRIVSKWGNYFKILKGIGALAFIAIGALVVNALMGTTGIPDKVKGGRLAIAIYDNQTGDKELDIIGNYISDGLYRGFDMLGDVKLSSPQVVKENHEYLGVLPGNERKKPSFYELTGARFTIEGSYYALGQDSVEFKTFVVDKISGETIYSFDPVKGSVHSNEHLLEDMQSHILGYWATREAVDKYNIHPPKFEAYQEYVKGNHKIGIDPEGATIHYLRAIEIDPDFTVAYSSLSMQYSAKGDFQKGDSIISILEVRSDNLTNRERYGLELYSAIKEGNFHKFFQLRYELYLNDPNHFDVNFHAGLAANRCNYAENAIEIFRKIDDSEINYSMLPYWYQWRLGSMAIAYNKMGQYQKTIDLIDRFLPISSNYPGAIVKQIQAYANLGLDGKIEQFASMRKGSTRMNQFRVNCEAAVNYYILFNQKMVMKFTERALHESELDSIPPSTLAEIFFMRQEFGKAKEICLDMIEQDTADVHWKTLLAVMEAHLLDQNPAFLEDFLIQINQNGLTNSRNNNWPSNVIPYASAIIYAQRGEKEKAMDYIHQSFESGVYFFYDRYDWDIFLRPLFDYPPFQEFVKPRRYVE